jgi:hypothetical protein
MANIIARLLIKGAMWAVKHPDQLIKLVHEVKDEKEEVKKIRDINRKMPR